MTTPNYPPLRERLLCAIAGGWAVNLRSAFSKEAAQRIVDFVGMVAAEYEEREGARVPAPAECDQLADILTAAEFSVRIAHVCYRAGINTVGDLVQWTRDELRSLKHMGDASLRIIDRALSHRGLELRK